jgi:patatin-like phospholipase/acyl hydrolase
MSKFKILSLDGGGVRGAYTASALAALQSKIDAGTLFILSMISITDQPQWRRVSN